jgi:hypothetical protein
MLKRLCLLAVICSLFTAPSRVFAEGSMNVVVKKGDFLIKIAEEYLEDPRQWKEVARINHLENPDLIYPGQILVVPIRLLRGTPAEGEVSFVQGDVMMQAEGAVEWVPLRLHDRIREGSIVKTGDNCAVEIVLPDGLTCYQQANTLLGLLKMREKGDVSEEMLSLERGRIVTKILRATGREPRFEIRTPSAVCAARGTLFRTSVDSAGDTRSEVLEGKAEVHAMMQKQEVFAGEGTLVRKGEPPLQPRKLLPPPEIMRDNKIYKTLPLGVAFSPVAGAVSFRISVSRDRDGREMVYEGVVRSGEAVAIQNLHDGTYYLHALSIDDVGLEGMPSVPEEVRVRVNPVPPFVSQPAKGSEYREKSLQCSWLSVRDAVAYQVQIAEDETFHRVVDEQTLAGTAYDTRELDYGSYYFRVRSVAEDGYEGAWSDSIPFTIVAPPPAPPVKPPAVDEEEMHILWQDLGEGVTYHFQMARDPSFAEVLIDDKTLEKPEIVIQKPEDVGTYYIHVSAIDSKGYEGKFSEPQTFTVKKGSFAVFVGAAAALGLLFILLP